MNFEELVMASIEAVDAGDPSRGKALALQAIDRQDDRAEAAWAALSYAERTLGDTKAAVDAANQAVRLDPASAFTWSALGDAYAYSTDTHLFEQAITCYDRALAIDQDDVDSWHGRGVMLMALGRYRESVASFDRTLALNPEHETAWTNRQIALLGADPARPPLLALAFKIAVERLKGQVAKRDLEPTVLHAFGGNAALDADLVMSFAVMARAMQEAQAPILGMPVTREDVRAIVQFCEVNLVLARHLGDNELFEGCERLYAEIAAAARTG
jgi:tetratricopeptide (TPR) repeat protein